MFDFLKKKIQGWIANKPEKVEKKPKKKAKAESKSIKEKPKSVKSSKSQTYSERKLDKEVDQLITESETPIQTEKIEKSQETEKESGNFFTKLLKKISTSKLSQTDFDEAFEDLEITLLENNVALEAVDAIRASLSQSLVDQQIKKTEAPARILAALKEAILSLLQEPPSIIKQIKEKKDGPFVILFFGINGTGKTTSIAKLAHYLKEEKISCVLAAADTFRAASIEQLQTHANKLKVPIVSSQYDSDPSSVAFDAISYAKSHKIQCVLIDTAGRMYTKSNLLKEMEKIIRVSKPDLKIFVGESITGNDAIEQARTFNETAGIDGIILSKADIDKKAGTILSVSHITKKPIYFLGTGQDYKDLTPFTKKTILKNLGLE
ncbi:MAG: signal recognition particle-docking protein FtsY [Nanoarchaeota archaeon]